MVDNQGSTRTVTRRRLLGSAAALGSGALLGGCVTGGSGGSGDEQAVTLQSWYSDPAPKKALATVVDGYDKREVVVNTVAVEQFRAQLPSYLNSGNPPDVLAWLAGKVAQDYARKGFLLDISDLWKGDGACASLSPALRKLSTDAKGRQIFVPTSYYWWGLFYRKSHFKKWGVEPVDNWPDFLRMCRKLKDKGVMPLTMGTGGGQGWVASGWFDYLDLRINGADFHRELLSGKHSFAGPEVHDVMRAYKELIPFIDPKGRSYSAQQAVTPLVQGKAAMYLFGAVISGNVPKDAIDDLDFFRVPVIDKSVPNAEEAPTDGYFAAAKADHPKASKDLLSYLVSPSAQETFVRKAKTSKLPTSTEADTSKFSPLVQHGIKFLNDSKDLTQFFNRDSSDELQTTADTALTKFLDKPNDVDAILKQWQRAAQRVFEKK